MQLAQGLRKHGFRKWYERQLLQSHAHLLFTLLCAIGVLATFEVFDRKGTVAQQLGDVLLLLVCTGGGIWALRRYLYLLTHAEATANQADCPQCKTYGRFDLQSDEPARQRLQVSCRRCGHCWPIAY
jgi:hypothetical protein